MGKLRKEGSFKYVLVTTWWELVADQKNKNKTFCYKYDYKLNTSIKASIYYFKINKLME